MPEGALLNRHRDKNGEISKKHGSTLVSTLRKIYGRNFARDCDDHEKLSDVLPRSTSSSRITPPVYWRKRCKPGSRIADAAE
jgi:hypothetical protein